MVLLKSGALNTTFILCISVNVPDGCKKEENKEGGGVQGELG